MASEQIALGTLAAVIADPGQWMAEFRGLPLDAFGRSSRPIAEAVHAIARRDQTVTIASVASELDRARTHVARETFEELGLPPAISKVPEFFSQLREQLALQRAEGLPVALQRAIVSTLPEARPEH